jgi:hypothetical protein
VTSTLFARRLIAKHPATHRSLFADQQCHVQSIVLDGEGDSVSLCKLTESPFEPPAFSHVSASADKMIDVGSSHDIVDILDIEEQIEAAKLRKKKDQEEKSILIA